MLNTDADQAELLVNLDTHLKANNVKNAIELIADNKYSNDLQINCTDCIKIILQYITEDNYQNNNLLFSGCEEILKFISTKCNPEECIFEYLEVIETTKNDTIFTSILKALQICIMQQKNNKARTLEWCLNSIQIYIMDLPLYTEKIRQHFDKEEEKLLEECDEVKRILTLYMTLFLFYEPILNTILEFHRNEQTQQLQQPSVELFANNKITRKNVLTCFLIQLFDRPLAYLDLSQDKLKSNNDSLKLTNIYSVQCATTLIKHFSQLFTDPFKLLYFVEHKILWPVKIQSNSDGIYENASNNIFLMAEKLPFTAVGVYYYLLLSENMMPETAPKIYTTFYIFEKCLYIVTELLKAKDEVVIYKALRLGIKTIQNLSPTEKLTINDLDLHVHTEFCKNLIDIITNSQIKRNAQNSLYLFEKYLFQFENDAKFLVIKHLFEIVENNGFYGILIKLYKDILHELFKLNENCITPWFSGDNFKTIFINHICKLKNGLETDILDHSDKIISALNLIIYLTIRDRHDQISFWDCMDTIQNNFLNPLEKAIDISKAHYNLEIESLKNGNSKCDDVQLNVSVGSSSVNNYLNSDQQMTSEYKLQVYRLALNTFDIMQALLARAQVFIKNNSINN